VEMVDVEEVKEITGMRTQATQVSDLCVGTHLAAGEDAVWYVCLNSLTDHR
jgi:hypothetical protein